MTRRERRRRMWRRPLRTDKTTKSPTKRTNPSCNPYPHKRGTSKPARRLMRRLGDIAKLTYRQKWFIDAAERRLAARKKRT